MIYIALHKVPRMFQIWNMKQVMNIAKANDNRPWEQSLCPLCPSCMQEKELCEPVNTSCFATIQVGSKYSFTRSNSSMNGCKNQERIPH
jgi:hypothetical protein